MNCLLYWLNDHLAICDRVATELCYLRIPLRRRCCSKLNLSIENHSSCLPLSLTPIWADRTTPIGAPVRERVNTHTCSHNCSGTSTSELSSKRSGFVRLARYNFGLTHGLSGSFSNGLELDLRPRRSEMGRAGYLLSYPSTPALFLSERSRSPLPHCACHDLSDRL